MEIPLDPAVGLVLVPVLPGDHAALLALMDPIYRDAYRFAWKDQGDWYVSLIYSPETLQKELNRARSHYFFVALAGKKIGILKYDYPFSPREIEIPNSMKLHRLYLHRDVHGKGIAKTLVAHCENEAKKNGLDSLWLEVMSCQPQAKRFYEKMGFEPFFNYQLDFEMLLPAYRGIEIWKKSLG